MRCHHPSLRFQPGQGAVEFLLAAVPVLLLGLGCIEAVHWHFARQAVSLALMQAARAAAVQQADPLVLDQAFAHALAPLFTAPSKNETRARLQRAMHRRTQATALPAWRIRILSPSTAAFAEFASHSTDLARPDGLRVIDNDYLHEQHLARLEQGWPAGQAPQSRQSVLDANTLALHLTWLHEPLLPGVRHLLRQLAPGDSRYGSLAMARGGFLPIRRELALVMQSHAVEWPMPAHGRIARNDSPELAAHSSRTGAHNGISAGHTPAHPHDTGTPEWPDQRPGHAHDTRSGTTPAAHETSNGNTAAYEPAPHSDIDMIPGAEAAAYRCTGLWCLGERLIAALRRPAHLPSHEVTGAGGPQTPQPGPHPVAQRTGGNPAVDHTSHPSGVPDARTDAPHEPESGIDLDDCPGCCG